MPSSQSNDTFSRINSLLVRSEKHADDAKVLLDVLKSNGEGQQSENLARIFATWGDLSDCLKQAQSELNSVRSEASHWRGQFLLSQIDMVSEIDRAESAEKKLSEAIQPLPYDQQKLVEERDLSWLAFTDPLTHLGNANKLDLELKKATENSLITGQLTMLFIIDIDKFRTVNEFGSWSQGNEVLEDIATRLVENVPKDTVLSRRAEDEFAMIVTLPRGELGESPLVRARQIADFLLKLLSEPLRLNNQAFPLSASIGISACPDDADTPVEMLENAYSALMAAKAKGGNTYVIYNDKVYAAKEDRARLAAELKQAIISNSISYLFRPVVDVKRGHLAAAIVEPEWHHPAHGRVLQDQVMILAEEHGLMPTLVDQIIGAGCELSRKLKGSISVILRFPQSVLNLHGFERRIMDLANQARIKPDSLVLDLPGSAVIESQAPLTRIFRELGRWGLKGSVGIAQNTPVHFSGLQQSHVGMVNLAPDLMESVPAQENRRGVVQSFLDASNRMGFKILVNGVSDASQGHFLAIHECDWAAGDFLSPSLNLDDFIKRRRSTWTLK